MFFPHTHKEKCHGMKIINDKSKTSSLSFSSSLLLLCSESGSWGLYATLHYLVSLNNTKCFLFVFVLFLPLDIPWKNAETLRAIVVCKYGGSYCCLNQSLWKQVLVQYTLSSAFFCSMSKALVQPATFPGTEIDFVCTMLLPWRLRQKKSRVLISFFFLFLI